MKFTSPFQGSASQASTAKAAAAATISADS
jgi:hypothetical protein